MPYTPPTNRTKRSSGTRVFTDHAKANVYRGSLTIPAETATGKQEAGPEAPPKEDLRKDSVCSEDEYREASATLWGSDYTKRKYIELNTGTAANITTRKLVCRRAPTKLT